jgi:predicted nucleic-acid-binding Zn-ribbon protein
MSQGELACPKCGGKMVEGSVKYVMESSVSDPMGSFSTGLSMGGLSRMTSEESRSAHWEEKTGKKTGLIFKSDETRQMRLKGLRCTACGYIELYAREK